MCIFVLFSRRGFFKSISIIQLRDQKCNNVTTNFNNLEIFAFLLKSTTGNNICLNSVSFGSHQLLVEKSKKKKEKEQIFGSYSYISFRISISDQPQLFCWITVKQLFFFYKCKVHLLADQDMSYLFFCKKTLTFLMII